MQKFDIKTDTHSISLFYNTIGECIEKCTLLLNIPITKDNITIDTKRLYLNDINKIINNSEDEIYIKNKKHYLYKSDKGLIPVHILQEDDFIFPTVQYIDGIYDIYTKKIKCFLGKQTLPLGWTICDATKFLQNCPYTAVTHLPMEFISKKSLIKEFKGKLINRKGTYIYKDKYGYYYIVDRLAFRTKEYKTFNGNEKAVHVEYSFTDYDKHIKWFSCIEEFENLWHHEYEVLNPSSKSSFAYYKILKTGYNAIHPDERKLCLRLPYFNVHMYDSENGTDNSKILLLSEHLLETMNNNYRWLNEDGDFRLSTQLFYEVVTKIYNEENKNKEGDIN